MEVELITQLGFWGQLSEGSVCAILCKEDSKTLLTSPVLPQEQSMAVNNEVYFHI